MSEAIVATVNNARVCTIDGRDCFVAAINAGRVAVEDFSTLDEALAWLRSELRRRDLRVTHIDVRRGDPGTPIERVKA